MRKQYTSITQIKEKHRKRKQRIDAMKIALLLLVIISFILSTVILKLLYII